jgi:hypothetical protein
MEGVKHERNALFVVNNTMVYENHRSGAFFVNVQHAPEHFVSVIRNNLCVGPIALTNSPAPDLAGNVLLKAVADALFVDPAKYDYHLKAGSPAIGHAVPAPTADGVDLTPKFQYVHAAQSVARPAAIPLDAGAFAFKPGSP